MSAQSNLDIIIRTLKQGNGDKETTAQLKSLSTGFQQMTGFSLGSVSALAAVGTAMRFVVQQAMESEQAETRLNAVLRATEGQSGMTMESLDRLATSVSNLSGIDDENVQSAESVLLTYRSLNEDIFPRTMNLAADMSAVFGTDLTTAVRTLGKALDSPTTGLTALRRMGVTFPQEQQTTIRTLVEENRLFEAQTYILDSLEGRIGGVAEAMGNTAQGQINKFKTEIGNLAEEIGGPLVSALGNALGLLNNVIQYDSRIQNTLATHSDEVVDLYTNYEDYEAELRRSAEAMGYVIDAEGNLVEIHRNRNETTRTLIQSNYMLSQSDWDAAQAQDASTQSAIDLDYALGNLRTTFAGSFGNEIDTYNERLEGLTDRQSTLNDEIAELSGQSYLSDAQREELGNLQEELADTEAAILDLAAAHEEAMRRMAFNMLMEQAASDGLTENELSNLTYIGQAWGLLDETTANMIEAVNGNLDNMDLTQLERYMSDLDHIMGLGDKTITIRTVYQKVNGNIISGDESIMNVYGAVGMASGAENFIVPPGYANDSYLIGLTSGEVVNVTPTNGMVNSPSPATAAPNIIQIYLDGRLISQSLADSAHAQGVA